MKSHPLTFLRSIALVLLGVLPARGGTYKHITIDGSFDDWIGVPVAYEDPADSEKSADYRKIWIANDDDYVYVRFTLERPEDPFTSNDNIFVDADADPGTGFGIVVGSEMLIQGGAGYQEKNGGFNEGGILGLGWQAAPSGAGREFEVRFSRQATYDSDKAPVFAGGTISILLEAEDANFARQETAPDAEGIGYEFAAAPPAFTGSKVLVPLAGTWRYRTAGGDPGTDWAAADYDDAGAGWASGAGLFGYTAAPGSYPAAVATALSPTPTTHYLRTRFQWNANPVGVVFVGTNYLSDGAALYLNGAEVKRVRLPAGTLTASTPATGGPAQVGQAEVYAFPVGALVEGENVLAAEVHQSAATPGDLVFGLTLFASAAYPAALADSTQPADRRVVGGESTVFAVEALGTEPLAYAWMRGGTEIPGATNATYVLDPVVQGDAGVYSVRVSNAIHPSGVTSRGAVLEVTSQPLVFSVQPQSQTVTEGQAARWEVVLAGSPPITLQWFRDNVAIDGATNAVLELPDVVAADAGSYRVTASNPATTDLSSLPAILSVAKDVAPPALLAVSGSPNRVRLQFSERLNPVVAQVPTNYAVAGLTVTSAAVDAEDASVVVLRTTAQTLGTVYEVTTGRLEDRFGNGSASARRRFVSSVIVDGNFEDWAGLEPAVDDPEDSENATDYGKVWITSDSDYVYLRVQLHRASDLGIFYNNLFVNGDGDAATGFGFRGVGSEMLIQGGGGYQQKGGGFNEGGIEGLDWLMAPVGVGTEFEVRFSRHARYANDHQPVFTAPTVSLVLESENTSFQTVDTAPDTEPIVHEFRNTPVLELGALGVVRTANGLRISWTGAGRLQSASALTDSSWQDVAGATSPYDVTAAGQARYYRLIQ